MPGSFNRYRVRKIRGWKEKLQIKSDLEGEKSLKRNIKSEIILGKTKETGIDTGDTAINS